MLENITTASQKAEVALQLWTLSDSAETQNYMSDIVYLFGFRAVGQSLHSHPENITQMTPSSDLLLSKAFSVSSPQTRFC